MLRSIRASTASWQIIVRKRASPWSSQTTHTPLAQWRKILDRAIREKLPILFVSLVAGEKPRPYAPPTIRGYTFPSIAVDGHDVVAVYRVASESIAHARKGHGPTLIESMHVSPGCPLRNMEDYLAAKGLSLDLYDLAMILSRRVRLSRHIKALNEFWALQAAELV